MYNLCKYPVVYLDGKAWVQTNKCKWKNSLLQQVKTAHTQLSSHVSDSEEKYAVIWDMMLYSLVHGCEQQLSLWNVHSVISQMTVIFEVSRVRISYLTLWEEIQQSLHTVKLFTSTSMGYFIQYPSISDVAETSCVPKQTKLVPSHSRFSTLLFSYCFDAISSENSL